jgi:XTP/dITP diphosphohydrolase
VPTPPAGGERPGERLLDLVAVMDRLRSPGGCPWDAEQTHESLVEYLVEETYETVEAIETGDPAALREELGDLLLQVVFHARIAAESSAEAWTIDDVADGIVTKLVRRHPHVFGDATESTAAQVESAWQARKAAEKGRESVTDGVPDALPALLLAAKILTRAGHGQVDVAVADPSTRDLASRALAEAGDEGLGDLLLALVAEARSRGLDPEAALRGSVRVHRAAIRAAEGLVP